MEGPCSPEWDRVLEKEREMYYIGQGSVLGQIDPGEGRGSTWGFNTVYWIQKEATGPSLPGSRGDCGRSPVTGPDKHDPGGGSNI